MSDNRLTVSVPSDEFITALGVDTRQVNLIKWEMTGPPPLETIDIVVPPYLGARETLIHLEGLHVRLVQGLTAGYDGVAEVLPAHMVFANAASVHETSTSEMTLALILASQRGIPDFVRAAEKGHWARAWYPSLADRSVLLVGYGGVGKAIESKLLAFETTVVRVARTHRTDDAGIIHAFTELPSLLADADIVVIVVPLTDETTHPRRCGIFVGDARRGVARQRGSGTGRRHGRVAGGGPDGPNPTGPRRHRSRTPARRSPPVRARERSHLTARWRCDLCGTATNGPTLAKTDCSDAER